MPYTYQTMNTYAAGDYYLGDSIFKRLGRGFIGGVKGFVTGGLTGAVRGAVTGAVGKPSVAATRELPPPPSGPMISPRGPSPLALIQAGRDFAGKQGPDVPATFPGAVPEPGFLGGVQRFLPFGQSGFTGAPPGYHVNKVYKRFLMAQAMGRPMQDPFSSPRAVNVIVRNRRTNPLNPRALKRSVSRQRGAVGLMRSVLAGTGYTIQRRGLGGKKRRARR